MNLDGFWLKSEMILALLIFSFSSSTRSLLADTKEISMPEKKAISKSVMQRKNISMLQVKYKDIYTSAV